MIKPINDRKQFKFVMKKCNGQTIGKNPCCRIRSLLLSKRGAAIDNGSCLVRVILKDIQALSQTVEVYYLVGRRTFSVKKMNNSNHGLSYAIPFTDIQRRFIHFS